MTTPRIEEIKHSFQELKRKSDNGLAINSPEQIAYCDALDDALPIVIKALTQAHTRGYEEGVDKVMEMLDKRMREYTQGRKKCGSSPKEQARAMRIEQREYALYEAMENLSHLKTVSKEDKK